jgi:hypothetical protein
MTAENEEPLTALAIFCNHLCEIYTGGDTVAYKLWLGAFLLEDEVNVMIGVASRIRSRHPYGAWERAVKCCGKMDLSSKWGLHALVTQGIVPDELQRDLAGTLYEKRRDAFCVTLWNHTVGDLFVEPAGTSTGLSPKIEAAQAPHDEDGDIDDRTEPTPHV